MVTINELNEILNKFVNATPPEVFIFRTAGSGVSDEAAVEFFKPTNQIVETRDGTRWQYGEKMKGETQNDDCTGCNGEN